ncbi:MAG: EamA family transporter [Bryobacteraceae bacterium]|nr:EamA family transporter [Bryobacteraceae bacterium]
MTEKERAAAWASLIAVCFFWGTTYLGIRMALESFPPLTLVAIRYVISGGVLLIAAAAMKMHIPRGRELWRTALFGVITLGIGNGCLAFAEQWIPSGMAALFLTTSPFWMVGIEALIPGGDRLHGPTMAGMLIGLSGVAFLLGPDAMRGGAEGSAMLAGFGLLQFGCAGWSVGSILQRRLTSKSHPVVSGAVQQLATGLLFTLLTAAIPQHPVEWSGRGVGALIYLITFGSIVGYSAYIYALDRLPVPVVSIYNYINPLVAVFLGWLIYREPFGMRETVAMAIIFLGVAVVKRTARH